MNAPTKFTRIVDGIRYSVSKATLIAHDCYWDGHNFERSGRNTFLYRTPRGRYFTVSLTQWQGEQDRLEPVDEDEARRLYEGPLSEHSESYADAFPDAVVEEA
ncbi:MAG: hypothetical protein HY328_15615 [Chloroflexi bacterium]|nr:hypothetical protein [Chloroflexota bacterium]